MKPMPLSSAARPAHPASTAQAPHSQSPLFMGRYDLRGASHFGGNNEVRKGVGISKILHFPFNSLPSSL